MAGKCEMCHQNKIYLTINKSLLADLKLKPKYLNKGLCKKCLDKTALLVAKYMKKKKSSSDKENTNDTRDLSDKSSSSGGKILSQEFVMGTQAPDTESFGDGLENREGVSSSSVNIALVNTPSLSDEIPNSTNISNRARNNMTEAWFNSINNERKRTADNQLDDDISTETDEFPPEMQNAEYISDSEDEVVLSSLVRMPAVQPYVKKRTKLIPPSATAPIFDVREIYGG